MVLFINGNQVNGLQKTLFGNSLRELEKIRYLVLGASMIPSGEPNKETKKAAGLNFMGDSLQMRETGFDNLNRFFNGEIRNFMLLKGIFKPPKGLVFTKKFYDGDIFIENNIFKWMTLLENPSAGGWQKFSQVAQVQRSRNNRKGIKNGENELILNDGKIYLIPTNAAEMPITSRNDFYSLKILKNLFSLNNDISEKQEERLINMKTGRNFEINSRNVAIIRRESLVNIILTLGNIDIFLYLFDMIRNISILTTEERYKNFKELLILSK